MTTNKKSKSPAKTDDDKHIEFLQHFQTQDDRSSVILAAALIELHLGALLKKALSPSTTSKDALLDERGAISTLYSRNHLSHRLGLIDIEMFRAIDAFRDIRNIYAHQLQYSDLSTEPYASKIGEVYKLISWYEPFVKMASTAFGVNHIGSMQFKAIAALVVVRLKQAVDELASLSAAEPKTLVSVKWEIVRMGIRARGGDA
jgi:DNA-binding MltR family transcriptional regulator